MKNSIMLSNNTYKKRCTKYEKTSTFYYNRLLEYSPYVLNLKKFFW